MNLDLKHRKENKVITQEEKEQFKQDVKMLMELAFDGTCVGQYELDLLERIRTSKRKVIMATIKEEFKKLYGNREVKLPSQILTIFDNYASPFSSGSNGYLTKVRLNKDNFEVYHDWWDYGWLSLEEVEEKYPCAACKIKSLINYLIK